MKQKKSLESRDSRPQRRWLVCASDRIGFDHVRCFHDHGVCHWKMSFKAEVGDIVYIYVSTEKKVLFKTNVVSINNRIQRWEDDKYWKNNPPQIETMTLIFLAEYYEDQLSDDILETKGYGRNSRQQALYRKTELLDYIEECFKQQEILQQQEILELGHDEYLVYHENYKEGNRITKKVNYYERSPELRNECIRMHGGSYVCEVCGIDFKTAYGSDLGKEFVHIHHIIPLGLIEELPDYKFKIDDLIPICPNCHAMVHRMLSKNKAKTEDACREVIDEIKNLVKQNRNGKEN